MRLQICGAKILCRYRLKSFWEKLDRRQIFGGKIGPARRGDKIKKSGQASHISGQSL